MSRIPKVVYTFWDTAPIPPLIETCVQTWRHHNPLYSIKIITKAELPTYNIPQDIIDWAPYPQILSDFVRLTVLAQHGGVWCDASVMMTQSLDWIHTTRKRFIGYHRKTAAVKHLSVPVIENWFFACTPHNAFVQEWLTEFSKVMYFPSLDAYVRHQQIDTQKIEALSPGNIGYLAAYVSAQVILQTDQQIARMAFLLTSEDGPLHYLHTSNWWMHKSIRYLSNAPAHAYLNWRLIKFTGRSRDALISMNNKTPGLLNKIYKKAIRCMW